MYNRLVAVMLVVALIPLGCRSTKTDREASTGETVCFHGFGYAGSLTPMMRMVVAYKDEPDAESVYYQISMSQTPENALYGLAGLKIVKSNHYLPASNRISRKFKDKKVNYGPGGCVAYDQTVEKVVSEVNNLAIE